MNAAEYVSVSLTSQKLIWLRQHMTDSCFGCHKPTIAYEDNQGCIKIDTNE